MGHAQVGRRVQQPKAAGTYRQHHTRRSRSPQLFNNPRVRPSGVTQTNEPPGKPGRFSFRGFLGEIERFARAVIRLHAKSCRRAADGQECHLHCL